MKRPLGILLLACFGAQALCSDADPVPGVKEHIPELDAAGQLILVVTESWEPGPATLRMFERAGESWRQVGEAMPAAIGKKGLAWGIGLHGTFPAGLTPKKEGDGKSPAGVFALDEIFGSLPATEAGIARFPYRQMTATFAGVDDPASRFYNRIVDAAVVAKDWSSAENMIPSDGIYRLGCVVRHNWRPFPGYGSCIFIHTRKGEAVPTSGCTAMTRPRVEQVLRWLDQEKQPILVQLPAAEYAARKLAWKLP